MIRGVIPSSLLDWPGTLSSVIYLGGCNWICEYCHNRNLHGLEKLTFDEAMGKMASVREMIDHVIISGGEPTLWKEYLEELVDELISAGYKVGLHTNGSNPTFLKHLMPKLSFVGMDIKGGSIVYNEWIHGAILTEIEKSVRIIQLSNVDHEFRCTVYPPYFDDRMIESLFNLLKDWHIKTIVLQQYMPTDGGALQPIKYHKLKTLVDKYAADTVVFYRGFDKFVTK